MPELPEMQALAERLHAAFAGAPLTAVSPMQFSAAKTYAPPIESLVDKTLQGVGHRAKYVVFDFGGDRLLLHLSQGGRVELEDRVKSTRPKGSVLRLAFGDRGALLVKEYGTQRKAGWWVLAPGDDGPLRKLGPDPFDDRFEELILGSDDNRRLHTMLRDQKVVSGIGRGYADDILHRARLSPYATIRSIDEARRRELVTAVRAVLTDALESERRRKGGLPPKLGDRFAIHNRAGEACPRCGEALRRVSYEDYEIAYCPKCQTEGKILADRRLSRLVK
jgi:formamidopyrimidine-DNA glycosylase